ncbi:hypothetical protein D3C81_1261940 [compost metagenome]
MAPAYLRKVKSILFDVSLPRFSLPSSYVAVAMCTPCAYSSSAPGKRCVREMVEPSEYWGANFHTAPKETDVPLALRSCKVALSTVMSCHSWRKPASKRHWSSLYSSTRKAACFFVTVGAT